jgi:hypothetical protein
VRFVIYLGGLLLFIMYLSFVSAVLILRKPVGRRKIPQREDSPFPSKANKTANAETSQGTPDQSKQADEASLFRKFMPKKEGSSHSKKRKKQLRKSRE